MTMQSSHNQRMIPSYQSFPTWISNGDVHRSARWAPHVISPNPERTETFPSVPIASYQRSSSMLDQYYLSTATPVQHYFVQRMHESCNGISSGPMLNQNSRVGDNRFDSYRAMENIDTVGCSAIATRLNGSNSINSSEAEIDTRSSAMSTSSVRSGNSSHNVSNTNSSAWEPRAQRNQRLDSILMKSENIVIKGVRHGSGWTEEEEAKLSKVYNETVAKMSGCKQSAIWDAVAASMHRTRNACQVRMRKLNKSKTSETNATNATKNDTNVTNATNGMNGTSGTSGTSGLNAIKCGQGVKRGRERNEAMTPTFAENENDQDFMQPPPQKRRRKVRVDMTRETSEKSSRNSSRTRTIANDIVETERDAESDAVPDAPNASIGSNAPVVYTRESGGARGQLEDLQQDEGCGLELETERLQEQTKLQPMHWQEQQRDHLEAQMLVKNIEQIWSELASLSGECGKSLHNIQLMCRKVADKTILQSIKKSLENAPNQWKQEFEPLIAEISKYI